MDNSSFDYREETVLAPLDKWEQLTPPQRFAANSLAKDGFSLAYVRSIQSENIAILVCGHKAVTVNSMGKVNRRPRIKIR